MNTITVNEIITSESSKSKLKTKEVTINLKHFVSLENSSKESSTVILSTGKKLSVSNEYTFLREQITKKHCIRFIEVNNVVTSANKTTNLKTVKLTINLEAIVSYEKTYLKFNPFREDLTVTGSIISLSTSDITVSDDYESVSNYIVTAKNNNF